MTSGPMIRVVESDSPIAPKSSYDVITRCMRRTIEPVTFTMADDIADGLTLEMVSSIGFPPNWIPIHKPCGNFVTPQPLNWGAFCDGVVVFRVYNRRDTPKRFAGVLSYRVVREGGKQWD